MSLRVRLAAIGGVASVVVFAFGIVGSAWGATSSGSTGAANGLKVSPVASNITIKPGETQTVQITVQNVTKSTVELQALVNDFTATDNETGEPALLLNPGQYAPSHSLKRYVAPISNFTLQSGEQKTITATITIPKNAPGGGYYGAVRFAPAGAAGSSNVTLSASVGSLILVRVPGDIKEQLELLSFDVRSSENDGPRYIFTSGKDLLVTARFQNQGDVQEQPFGKVVLQQGNTQLASYELNNTTPRGNVLPASIRKFTVTLDKVGSFGAYTLTGNFGYGNSGQLVSGKLTFYVIPVGLILTIVTVIALILFAIFVLPRLIRAYNRSVVAKANRGR